MRRRKGEGGESTLRRAGPTVQSAGPLHAGSKAALSPWRRLTSCPRPPTQLSLRTTRGQEAEAMFRPSVVKDCIHAVLKEELANAEYSPEEMPQLTKHLSENIKDKLKEMGFDRYKMVVQVVIGEQRGEGVFMAARCFWDADTDNCTHDVFMNDSLFCVVAAFGCFYY
uniref:Tctex1 domain containing 2 n=1 Tax=Capra hircus TaxID=9925 RepID=A0A8C2NEN9_CAPHI